MAASLWGEIRIPGQGKSPLSILREQATALAEATDGLLEGEVSQQQAGEGFMFRFHIVAPALNNYKYLLLQVEQPIELYPLSVFPNVKGVFGDVGPKVCGDQAEFEVALREIFTSAAARNIIVALLTQSQD